MQMFRERERERCIKPNVVINTKKSNNLSNIIKTPLNHMRCFFRHVNIEVYHKLISNTFFISTSQDVIYGVT